MSCCNIKKRKVKETGLLAFRFSTEESPKLYKYDTSNVKRLNVYRIGFDEVLYCIDINGQYQNNIEDLINEIGADTRAMLTKEAPSHYFPLDISFEGFPYMYIAKKWREDAVSLFFDENNNGRDYIYGSDTMEDIASNLWHSVITIGYGEKRIHETVQKVFLYALDAAEKFDDKEVSVRIIDTLRSSFLDAVCEIAKYIDHQKNSSIFREGRGWIEERVQGEKRFSQETYLTFWRKHLTYKTQENSEAVAKLDDEVKQVLFDVMNGNVKSKKGASKLVSFCKKLNAEYDEGGYGSYLGSICGCAYPHENFYSVSMDSGIENGKGFFSFERNIFYYVLSCDASFLVNGDIGSDLSDNIFEGRTRVLKYFQIALIALLSFLSGKQDLNMRLPNSNRDKRVCLIFCSAYGDFRVRF